ncbi:hypothetical protein K438DRAFT_1960107 [Mycena galopus ATCC 62051]|nr:hypothetical protein K438DRAFT_1960107 [Mycena galopus ATCC 62051]
MSDHVPAVFAAIHQAIHDPDNPDRPHIGEIVDDLEAEGETLPDEFEDDTPAAFDLSQLQDFLQDASKGVTNDTDKEYKRLMQKCLKFLKENKLIKENDTFFSNTPDKLVPFCICAWIMHE